jgi:hypothetical protein
MASGYSYTADNSRISWGMGVAVHINLLPLSRALAELPKEAFTGNEISWALNKGIKKFDTASYRALKADTKMVAGFSRLRRGVRLHYAAAGALEARYVITDRNLVITKAYFSAGYSNYAIAGARARWGQGASPIGANWVAWDGGHLGKRTFMVRGRKPVFIRLGKAPRKMTTVKGPNPAQLMQIHGPKYLSLLKAAADAELVRQVERAYVRAEKIVKARHGL